MPVERNKDGSVTIKNNILGIAIGRTTLEVDDNHKERFQQWVEKCAVLVKACPHTLQETEEYFLQCCDALPLDPNDWRMKFFQYNVVMNYCKDKLKHKLSEFSFDMTDEEIERWHREQNALREEIMNSPPEDFGLNIRGYYLPRTERNAAFYEETYLEAQKIMRQNGHNPKQIKLQDICFFFEETTGHCQSDGGGYSLMNQLIVFRGVSEEDITERNPRFLGYIDTLREMGILPDFTKE